MPIGTVIAGLATVVPSILRWAGRDKEAEIADKAAGIARHVAGIDDTDAAVEAIKANPELQLKMREAWQSFELGMYEQETERLAIVNQTMRAEYETKDKWRGRWRPYWGYISGTAFGLQIFGLLFICGWAIMSKPTEAATIIDSVARLVSSLTVTWTIALTVLGVAVHKRSSDKRTAMGAGASSNKLSSLMSGIIDRVKPGGKS